MSTDRSGGWGSRAAKLLTLAALAAVVADALLMPARRDRTRTAADASSPERPGWRPRGAAKVLALAALAAVVAGAMLLPARGDRAGTAPETAEDVRQAAVEAEAQDAVEPASASGGVEAGRAVSMGPVAPDDPGADERRTSEPPVAAAAELPEVSIVSGPRLVTEAQPVEFTLARTGAAEAALTVVVGVAESGSMLSGAGPVTATFGAGERTTTLSVAVEDDFVVDITSRVTATITPGDGYTVDDQADSAAVYVTDNDRIFLLPDLVSDPPVPSGEVERVWWNGEEMLVLRFEGYVTNLGDGPLDLSGNPQLADPADPTSHDVWQRVRTSTGDWVKLTKPPVRYETEDGHNHFHLVEIVAYSLWNEAGTTQVLQGSKVGFCMLDVEQLDDRHPDPGERAYEESVVENCRANDPDADYLRMGVTEGWRDVYEGKITFQWVDVSDLRPGHYRLAAEADPYDVVVESDETNNSIALTDEVSVVPGYVAQPLAVATEIDTAVDVVLTATTFGKPIGPRYFRIVTAPAHGSLDAAVDVRLSGTILWYTPDEGFSGVDTFEYEAFDVYSAYPRTAVRAVVAITVGEAAAKPVAGEGGASGGVATAAGEGGRTAPVITDPGAQSPAP